MNWGSILKFGLLGFFVGVGISLFIPTVFIDNVQSDPYISVLDHYPVGKVILNIVRYGVIGSFTFICFTLAYQLRKK
ncbi:hypothetical protein [Alkalicoccobacillus murimartini]|uniref:DUF4321 domain-containing protein n=1 Tax=Alkalicoccobacillus murimartini TaxID=171685 RepID=A0ABT9YL38_9BACI|nr:hypothetical protein [Alkalicoccobacillus murimartini]MDQ0208597.1 hypothetical protein [Alkalicoccobacillus murimartini]